MTSFKWWLQHLFRNGKVTLLIHSGDRKPINLQAVAKNKYPCIHFTPITINNTAMMVSCKI